MGKLIAAGLVAMVVIVPANAAPKMSYGACKTKVMQDPRNLRQGTFCDKACVAAIKRCQAGG
jgi:hypothetical protein